MESALNWQYDTLVNELTQGMENAKQLRFHLRTTSPSQAQDLLLQKILSAYDNALSILKWGGSQAAAAPILGAPESSVSADGSPGREDLSKTFRDNKDHANACKKRKMQPTWTEQVKIHSQNGLEGPGGDGHSWRKYGQKYILGAKYPRSYYRCTYRLVQNCWATKQVQRSDDDLSVFDITYKGTHTCNQPNSSESPEKLEPNTQCFEQQNEAHPSLKTNLVVTTEGLGDEETPNQFSFQSAFLCHDTENHYFPIPAHVDGSCNDSRFLSPATSGSNYFSAATYPTKSYGEAPKFLHSETQPAEIISAHASTTNSPIGGMDLFIGPLDLETNFLFDTSDFFSYSNFEF